MWEIEIHIKLQVDLIALCILLPFHFSFCHFLISIHSPNFFPRYILLVTNTLSSFCHSPSSPDLPPCASTLFIKWHEFVTLRRVGWGQVWGWATLPLSCMSLHDRTKNEILFLMTFCCYVKIAKKKKNFTPLLPVSRYNQIKWCTYFVLNTYYVCR